MSFFGDEYWDTSMSTVLTQKNHSTINASMFKDSFSFENPKQDQETFFGLSVVVKHLLQKYKGIDTLYGWQEECLRLEAIEKKQNLLYSLPTSGGKTLVAEILMLQEILLRNKNVIFVLPYVALAQEKVRSLSPFGLDLGFYIEEYVGGKGLYPPSKHRKKRTIYVCTVEKASGLVESLIQTDRLVTEVGMMVIDEVHLIGDKSRGAVLEMLLTKLMYIGNSIQIIAMSATIGNLDEIAKFLKAKIYTRNFRPVELSEFVKCEDEIFKVVRKESGYSSLELERKMHSQISADERRLDPSCLGVLVREVIPQDSCLVFCSTKKGCCNFAMLICKTIQDRLVKELKKEEKISLLRALSEEGQGEVCPILRKTIPYGVAYHHSGLTNAERKLLEEAFLSGTICCICCTSTLAAGVNLPAKRVIIFSPHMGKDFLKLSSYRQMSGRAGRMGLTDAGQSFLICQRSEMPKVAQLLESTMDFCESMLNSADFSRLVISSVGLNIANTNVKLCDLLRHSLLYVQATARRQNVENVDTSVDACLKQLKEKKAITVCADTGQFSLTPLSTAAMAGNLSIEEAQLLYNDLDDAVTNGLILNTNLHLFYLVIPYSVLDEIVLERDVVLYVFSNLSPAENKIALRLGINEGCLCQFFRSGTVKIVPERVWKKFLLSLIIFGLWNSSSIWKISEKFSIPRGTIHSFLTRTAAFASSVQRFAEALCCEKFECIPSLLQKIMPRIAHCCTAELLQLMQLPAVKIGRAQQLYKAGYRTLSDIANVDPQTLVSCIDHMPRKVAYEIVATAKLLMLQKAEMLQEEAECIKEDLKVASNKNATSATSTPLRNVLGTSTTTEWDDDSAVIPSSTKKLRF